MKENIKALIVAIREIKEVNKKCELINKINKDSTSKRKTKDLITTQYKKIEKCIEKVKGNHEDIDACESIDINGAMSENNPLFAACDVGDAEIVLKLLKAGANPNFHLKNNTPLRLAIKNNWLSVVIILIAHGADFRRLNQDFKHYPIYLAAREGNEDIIRHILQKYHASPMEGDDKQIASAILYCLSFNDDLIRIFIQEHVGLSVFNQSYHYNHNTDGAKSIRITPLSLAVFNELVPITKALLKLGVDVNSTDQDQPALNYAVNNIELIKLLFEHGACPENTTGEIALLLSAIKADNLNVINFLLSRKKIDINAPVDERPLLSHAAELGARNAVLSLLYHGANVDGIEGKVEPIYYAVIFSRPEITQLLLNQNARIDANNNFENILMAAAGASSLATVKLLVATNQLPAHFYTQVNKQGQNAIQIAAANNHMGIVCYLASVMYPHLVSSQAVAVNQQTWCAEMVMKSIASGLEIEMFKPVLHYLYRPINATNKFMPDYTRDNFYHLFFNNDSIKELIDQCELQDIFVFMHELNEILADVKLSELSILEIISFKERFVDFTNKHEAFITARTSCSSWFEIDANAYNYCERLKSTQQANGMVTVFGTLMLGMLQDLLLSFTIQEMKKYSKIKSLPPANALDLFSTLKMMHTISSALLHSALQVPALPSCASHQEFVRQLFSINYLRITDFARTLKKIYNPKKDEKTSSTISVDVSSNLKNIIRANKKRANLEAEKIRAEESARYKKELEEQREQNKKALIALQSQKSLLTDNKKSQRNKKKRLASKEKAKKLKNIQNESVDLKNDNTHAIVAAELFRLKKLDEDKLAEAESRRKEKEYQEEKRKQFILAEEERKKSKQMQVLSSPVERVKSPILQSTDHHRHSPDQDSINSALLCQQRKDIIHSVFKLLSGIEAELVGGAVIKLLNQSLPIKDFDFVALDKGQYTLLEKLGFYQNHHVKLQGCLFFSYTGNTRIDLLLVQSDSPNWRFENALTRDLTINTLLCNEQGVITDVTGRGIPDFQSKMLSITHTPDFYLQDPVRVLRTIKSIAELAFLPDEQLDSILRNWDARFVSISDPVKLTHFFIKFDEFVKLNPNFLKNLQSYDLLEKMLEVRKFLNNKHEHSMVATRNNGPTLFSTKQIVPAPAIYPFVKADYPSTNSL